MGKRGRTNLAVEGAGVEDVFLCCLRVDWVVLVSRCCRRFRDVGPIRSKRSAIWAILVVFSSWWLES